MSLVAAGGPTSVLGVNGLASDLRVRVGAGAGDRLPSLQTADGIVRR